MQIIVLNIPIFYAAYRLLDKDYVICGVFGMLIFSFATDATRFLADVHLIDDTMLAAIYGGVITGIGSVADRMLILMDIEALMSSSDMGLMESLAG